MSTNPLISIVTVSFNSVKTIEKTILSVLSQTYKNYEYIIIDGGSIDGTLDIIEKYKNNFSYFVSEKDNGISDAFNKGIRAARGEIIGILNSDDWYEPDALEKIVKLDSENRGDFYVGALKYWNYNTKKSHIIYPDLKYKKTIAFRMPHLNHPAAFFRKETYDDVGLFNNKYRYAMDYDLFMRVDNRNKKGIFTKEVISNMLLGGASNINNKKAYREVFFISRNKILGLIWYILSISRVSILSMLKRIRKIDFLIKEL